jgi:D-sedoheptulose 7-phosphate isomerase
VDQPLDAQFIRARIDESLAVKRELLAQADVIAAMGAAAARALRAGGALLTFGNGGSAADAQHIAAELSGRFSRERPPLAAEALTVNTSALTAIANDYGYDEVFNRQLQGRARRGDVALGISTSGNSRSVILALESARRLGLTTLGMTGSAGGLMRERGLCDHLLLAPSRDTARIQECHILAGHLICEWVERALFDGPAGAP